MIPNIIVPIITRGGNIVKFDKDIISLFLAIFVVSIIVALIGYLYDGIKTKEWRHLGFAERCVATDLGLMFAVCDIIIAAVVGIFVLIKSWL